MLHWFTVLLKKSIRSLIATHLVYIFRRYSGFISPLLVIVGIAFEMKKEFPQLTHALGKCVISSKIIKSSLQ